MRWKNGSFFETTNNGLITYSTIVAATKSDAKAMDDVLQHFGRYMASLSTRKFIDEHGNSYYGVDKDVYDRLCAKLICAVLKFRL